jgi:hypothetical protein
MAKTQNSTDAASRSASASSAPLLRDHLPKKSRETSAESAAEAINRPDLPEPDESKARGRATRSPDEVATRRHLEGAEQGPM